MARGDFLYGYVCLFLFCQMGLTPSIGYVGFCGVRL